jgi:hypothetical protein
LSPQQYRRAHGNALGEGLGGVLNDDTVKG